MKLRAGDWVEVRSRREILNTLDKNGQLDKLPFMPQMLQYCGQRFKVYKRAHKTCDTVNQTGGRRLANAVHLDLRCDGEAYGGCQAACLIFWKTAWLKPVNEGEISPDHFTESSTAIGQQIIQSHIQDSRHQSFCSEADLLAATRAQGQQAGDVQRYICQATQLPYYTTLLPWWDLRQYLEDYTSRNITFDKLIRGIVYSGCQNLIKSGFGLGSIIRWSYDSIQILWGGIPYPRRTGKIPVGESTPSHNLNLKPGELVRVKSYKEILATLNIENKNHGLYFDAELVPYCGGIYSVRTKVNKFINEKTGMMVTMQNDAIILEKVWCQARYSDCRMFCPRSIYSWWREIWLERYDGVIE